MSRTKPQRGKRYFTEEIKRDSVVSYETGRQSVIQICDALKVSPASVYKWIDKYSTLASKGIQIVEKQDSQTEKLKSLQAELDHAHRLLARQTIQLDYFEVLHEYLETELDVDIKKAKSASQASSGSATKSGSKKAIL